jgi:hypothetical protein
MSFGSAPSWFGIEADVFLIPGDRLDGGPSGLGSGKG